MDLLARSLVACACAVLLSHASGNVLALDLAPTVLPSIAEQPALGENCTILQIGEQYVSGMRVISYDDDMPFFTPKDKALLLPKVAVFGILKGAKITACNPTGRAPFLIANDGDNISGELHCSFAENPKRCPLGLSIHIEEYYMVPPLGSAP